MVRTGRHCPRRPLPISSVPEPTTTGKPTTCTFEAHSFFWIPSLLPTSVFSLKGPLPSDRRSPTRHARGFLAHAKRGLDDDVRSAIYNQGDRRLWDVREKSVWSFSTGDTRLSCADVCAFWQSQRWGVLTKDDILTYHVVCLHEWMRKVHPQQQLGLAHAVHLRSADGHHDVIKVGKTTLMASSTAGQACAALRHCMERYQCFHHKSTEATLAVQGVVDVWCVLPHDVSTQAEMLFHSWCEVARYKDTNWKRSHGATVMDVLRYGCGGCLFLECNAHPKTLNPKLCSSGQCDLLFPAQRGCVVPATSTSHEAVEVHSC